MRKALYILSLLVLASGCQTVLDDVDVPTIPVKAVVFANFSNLDDMYELALTKSKPIINNSSSNDFESIVNAQVSVVEGTSIYDFNYDLNENYRYAPAFTLVPGTEYRLSVQTPSLGTQYATVTMPHAIGDYTMKVDSVVKEYEKQYTVVITMPDQSLPEYFRIEAYTGYGPDLEYVYSSNEYFSDENATDGTIKLKTTLYLWNNQSGFDPNLEIVLSSITKDHYKYGKVFENYEPDNPFKEPTPLPSNVEGGLGIFTLSNSIRIRVK